MLLERFLMIEIGSTGNKTNANVIVRSKEEDVEDGRLGWHTS